MHLFASHFGLFEANTQNFRERAVCEKSKGMIFYPLSLDEYPLSFLCIRNTVSEILCFRSPSAVFLHNACPHRDSVNFKDGDIIRRSVANRLHRNLTSAGYSASRLRKYHYPLHRFLPFRVQPEFCYDRFIARMFDTSVMAHA